MQQHKRSLSFLFCVLLFGAAAAQTQDPAALVRRVADHIIQTTTFRFVNSKTNETFTSTKGLTPSPDVKAESKFNKWMYVNGVLAVGMMQTAAVLKDPAYSDYARKNYNFIFSNLDYFKKQFDAGVTGLEWRPVLKIGSLDDCGSMAAGLLEVYALDKNEAYMDYLQRVGDYIKNKQVRFPDGTLARNNPRKMTLWADDLYMSVPFLARMGKTTGDRSYFDFAVQQVEAFNRYIYDSLSGLYYHVYYNDENTNGVAHWGRCNGWVALAQSALLDALPADDPRRPRLQKMLLRQIIGFSRCQDSTGMWHQVLDRPDSYPESSVTAMFVYTVAHAVNKGWISPRYLSIALNGWEGLSREVTADGQLRDICIGTNVEENIRFYYARPRETNDTHGLGAFLLAGTELILAKEKAPATTQSGAATNLSTTAQAAPATNLPTATQSTPAANLPAPYSTTPTKRTSKVIGWPEGRTPIAPAGFKVTKFADHLNSPRWFYLLPNGDLLVSESQTNRKKSANDILLFRDTNHDGMPDLRDTFMTQQNQPLGMLLLNDWFYVGNTDGVYRYPYKKGQLHITGKGQKILDLPAGGYNNHWTRNLIASADGSRIFVSVGSGSNNAEHGMDHEARRADILTINPDGSGERVYAAGIRNPVGMDWAPGTQTLWTAVNERDSLGDDLVPDYFTSVKEGAFYGWPYAYFGPNEDPRLKGQRPDLVAKTIVPDVPVGAHTASLGLSFYTKKAFPAHYYNGAFIGQHGSWNRSTFAGYRVIFVPFSNGKPGAPEDFLTGFIADESANEVYGRPVGVFTLPDGSLLVADDAGNTIWRVTAE